MQENTECRRARALRWLLPAVAVLAMCLAGCADAYMDNAIAAPYALSWRAEPRLEPTLCLVRPHEIDEPTSRVDLFVGRSFAAGLSLSASHRPVGFGWRVQPLDDLDRDGVTDLLVAACGNRSGGSGLSAISGRTGAALYSIEGRAGDRLGFELCGVGDLDSDGTADFAVSSPESAGEHGGVGRVVLASGRDGHTLSERRGDENAARFGFALAFCASDSRPNGVLAVSSISASPKVEFFELGAQLAPVGTLMAPTVWEFYGWALAAGTQQRGPSERRHVLALSRMLTIGGNSHVQLIDTDTRDVLWDATGFDTVATSFGCQLAIGNDHDLDGCEDILVGCPGHWALPDRLPLLNRGIPLGRSPPPNVPRELGVCVLSGASGSLLRTIVDPRGGQGFGSSIRLLDDFDSDGVRDYAIGYAPASRVQLVVLSGRSWTVLKAW